jgi:hypothetical protein
MGELQTEATVGAAAGVCALTSDSCRRKEMATTSGRGLHTPLPVILPSLLEKMDAQLRFKKKQ